MDKTLRLRSVTTGCLHVLTPAHEINVGGEGRIYALPTTDQSVAKLYYRPVAEQARKLEVMIKHAGHAPIAARGQLVCCWPEELLVTDDRRGAFVGFIMPRVHNMRSIIEVYNPQARQRYAPHFDYRYLARSKNSSPLNFLG